MKPMKVYSLLTIPPGHSYKICTLVLNSIRIGFPTAQIKFDINHTGDHVDYDDLFRRGAAITASCHLRMKPIHHFDWIQEILCTQAESEEPFVIVDGDIVFWSSMEDMKLYTTLTGMFIPEHKSDFYNSYCASRLHTSLLFFRSGKEVFDRVRELYPEKEISGIPQTQPWFFQELIRPQYTWLRGKPIVYDTCSMLYQCLDGTPFDEDELNCYDHLNSAAFLDVMLNKVMKTITDRDNFFNIHALAERDPELIRGVWRAIYDYYNSRSISLYDYLYASPIQE